MISFGLWIAGLFGKRIDHQTARRVGVAVALPLFIIAAVLLAWGGKALYDRGLRKQVMDERKAEVAKSVVEADREATANAIHRADVAEAERDRLENAMGEAKQADPAKGTSEVGPVQQSYFDNLPKRRR